jgi:glycosyltransferase involved in cell wall biosynthesis
MNIFVPELRGLFSSDGQVVFRVDKSTAMEENHYTPKGNSLDAQIIGGGGCDDGYHCDLLSIVIPCFNESESINLSYRAIASQLDLLEKGFEIIFVDDGSTDTTLECLVELATLDSRVKYISFSRNFGKESAMLAGLRLSNGDCVIIMDADLQHPPELIGRLLEKFYEGFDQVIAQRTRDGDSRISSWFAQNYYRFVNKMIDVNILNGAGDFRLLSRRAINALLELEENNRFSKGLFSWIGFRQSYISYQNRQRVHGETKWSFRQLVAYGIDGILSFNSKPLRLCIYLGLILILLSIVYLIAIFVQILRHGVDAPGYFTSILLITCLGGAQLMSLGIVGEYIGRIYSEVKKRPNYLIAETNIKTAQSKRSRW